MHRRRVRLLWLSVLGLPLLVAALVSILWPGALALDDRLPLALLFGLPVVVIAERIRRELA